EFELHRIVIARDSRRQGYASALLGNALARDPGVWLLEVAASNQAARRLYALHAFREVGRRSAYYPNGDDAILMRREP
ncbi:MAG: GNAT family N-acetyltransferase, partial [Myxococcota bacterium]